MTKPNVMQKLDKKQKSCVKRIHLVADNDLYDRNTFYKVKNYFYSSSINDGQLINYLKKIVLSLLILFSCEKSIKCVFFCKVFVKHFSRNWLSRWTLLGFLVERFLVVSWGVGLVFLLICYPCFPFFLYQIYIKNFLLHLQLVLRYKELRKFE